MSKKKVKTVLAKEENVVVTENPIKNFFIILGIMLVLFIAFYYLTVWIKYEKKKYVPVDHQSEIRYDKILLSNILNYNGEYYVLAVDGDYEEYFQKIEESLGVSVGSLLKKDCYTVSLNDKMNEKYISDKSNLKVTNINDLKVSTTTLIHIKNKKIVAAYEGSESIFEYLHKALKK